MKSAINNREPAVAGQFYPGRPAALEQSLDACFAQTRVMLDKPVRALICPHAGYVFSGAVAATAITQLNRPYKRVILLGASHQLAFQGVSAFCSGDFTMPFGTVPVDKTVGKALVKQHPHLFSADPSLQLQEHSLEVLLPLLHRKLGHQTPIVPILIGTIEPGDCEQVAMALKPWFTPDTLFIISTDFSHYPNSEAAKQLDAETMEAICSNQPAQLEKVLGAYPQPRVRGLVTRLCGWRAVLTLMHLTTQEALTYHPLTYAHSGENPLYGEADRVVGYWAMAVTENTLKTEPIKTHETMGEREKAPTDGSFYLTASAKAALLAYSRQVLQAAVKGQTRPKLDPAILPDYLKAEVGAFVTLHNKGRLRGCIGQMTANRPLYLTIAEMTVSAALHDGRFQPVKPEELAAIDIELSILSPLEPIETATDIELGRHGILIEKGWQSGVFLPQVATETGWDLENFLGHCSRDKAGLTWDGWKQATVYRFTATIFGENTHELASR